MATDGPGRSCRHFIRSLGSWCIRPMRKKEPDFFSKVGSKKSLHSGAARLSDRTKLLFLHRRR